MGENFLSQNRWWKLEEADQTAIGLLFEVCQRESIWYREGMENEIGLRFWEKKKKFSKNDEIIRTM